MKAERKVYLPGQELEVDIHQPQRGKFPIGRADTGIVCKLLMGDKVKFLPYGCSVNTIVREVRDNHLVVDVISISKTVEENKLEFEERLSAFKKRTAQPQRKQEKPISEGKFKRMLVQARKLQEEEDKEFRKRKRFV